MMNRRSVAVLAAAILLPAGAFAQQPTIEASQAWLRATPPRAAAAAAYLTLTSSGGDRLIGVSTPVAGSGSVHSMTMEGNVMRMRAIPGGLELPAGKAVALEPGGYHLMLEQLQGPLKPGQMVPLRLTFEKSAPIDLMARVEPIGASGPAGAHGTGHAMPSTRK